jgi:hypothetical protein
VVGLGGEGGGGVWFGEVAVANVIARITSQLPTALRLSPSPSCALSLSPSLSRSLFVLCALTSPSSVHRFVGGPCCVGTRERTRIIMRKVRAPDSGSGSPTLGTPSATPAAMDTPAVVFFDNPLRAVPTP